MTFPCFPEAAEDHCKLILSCTARFQRTVTRYSNFATGAKHTQRLALATPARSTNFSNLRLTP